MRTQQSGHQQVLPLCSSTYYNNEHHDPPRGHDDSAGFASSNKGTSAQQPSSQRPSSKRPSSQQPSIEHNIATYWQVAPPPSS
jgi:hypothetical protein